MAGAHYGYRPQIDGLRAIAVGGVLLTHFWFPHGPFGHLGVRLFFVISGFLITERLLDARASIEGGASHPLQEGVAYFLRRALRLFPAYYLLLTLLLITDAGGIRASAPWHIFNLTNVWFVKIDDWSPWMIAHFWSLSIEEQFYLVWPWVILLLPLRAFGPVVVGTILLGIGFRAGVLMTPLAERQVAIWVLTPAAFDALGAGALLALLARNGRDLAPGYPAVSACGGAVACD
jgi:peptidoglycan/LPS O-acetylase OafA/YrhL